jgi:hypothetical protein
MLTAALVIAAWAALFVVVRVMLARSCSLLRQDFQRQIDALAARLDSIAAVADLLSTSVADEIAPDSAHSKGAAAAILATKKIHVRPVKPPPAHAAGDPWAQQGRTGVHSSHDIVQRGH